MLIKHGDAAPKIDSSAYVAPNAVVCGDVTIGPGCRVMHGAQVIAEGGSIEIGRECIVMENAVLRSADDHPLSIGNNCLIGPNAHVVGSTVEDEVFIATGAAVFHASHIGRNSEIRINAVVHVNCHLDADQTVPIGWIAVGRPARIFSPDKHSQIWESQAPMNFPLTVYGVDRDEASMTEITRRVSERLASHVSDETID